ncbi:hypothetical protein DYB32_010314, partial [Aphanomyces invadans]
CVSDFERLRPLQPDQLVSSSGRSIQNPSAVEMSSLVTNAEAFTSSDIYEKYKDFVLRLTARDPRRQRLFQASFEMFALEQANFDSSSDDDLSAPRTSPPDSDDEVEVESTPKRGQKREVESLVKPRSVAPSTPRAPIVLDAEALKRLDHVKMSDAAK